jgi:hypothetical protein
LKRAVNSNTPHPSITFTNFTQKLANYDFSNTKNQSRQQQ